VHSSVATPNPPAAAAALILLLACLQAWVVRLASGAGPIISRKSSAACMNRAAPVLLLLHTLSCGHSERLGEQAIMLFCWMHLPDAAMMH
jgi:hypothetical protein